MMSENADVPIFVRDIIGEWLVLRHAQIIPEARFIEDLGADEIDVAAILMDLQYEYHKKNPDLKLMPLDIAKVRTVGDLLGILREKGVI